MSGFRRTWDKEVYEKKAKQRVEGYADEPELNTPTTKKTKKEEFQPAEPGAQGPIGSERAFLNARSEKIDIETKVGKVEVIDPSNVEKGAGYWCEVCACLLKDSASYLDHINGKKHQRALGFSMRVERADADRVKKHIEDLKNNINAKANKVYLSSMEAHELKVSAALAAEEEKKKKKQEEKLRKAAEIEKTFEDADPEIAELMGFQGFGGSKKK